jgi:hypothetical protein
VTVCEWRNFHPEAVYELIALPDGPSYVVATIAGLEFTVPLDRDDLTALAKLATKGVGDEQGDLRFEGQWVGCPGPHGLWQLGRTTPQARATLAFERAGAGLARFALGLERVLSGRLPAEPDLPPDDGPEPVAAGIAADGASAPPPFDRDPSDDELEEIEREGTET